MTKIIAISTTHRNKSNTEAMLLECINEIRKSHPVELVKLRELNMDQCDGCVGCDEEEKCHIKDSFSSIYPKILSADIWIISSPEYWWNVSGLCKNFIDRLNPYWKKREQYFKGKKVAILTCGGQPLDRNFYAENYLKHFFSKLYFDPIGSVRASADLQEEVLKQPLVLEECRKLGEKITKIAVQK